MSSSILPAFAALGVAVSILFKRSEAAKKVSEESNAEQVVAQVANTILSTVTKENFKTSLKTYCFENKSIGQKFKNTFYFIFLTIANIFNANFAVSRLNNARVSQQ